MLKLIAGVEQLGVGHWRQMCVPCLKPWLTISELHYAFWHPGTLGKQPWITAAWSSKQFGCAPIMHGMCTAPQLVRFQPASKPSTHSAAAHPVVDQSTHVSLKPTNQ